MGRMIRGVSWQSGTAWELGDAPNTDKEHHGFLRWPHNVWYWATPEGAAAFKQSLATTAFDKDLEADALIRAECLQAYRGRRTGDFETRRGIATVDS